MHLLLALESHSGTQPGFIQYDAIWNLAYYQPLLGLSNDNCLEKHLMQIIHWLYLVFHWMHVQYIHQINIQNFPLMIMYALNV